ncbi:MAG: response regulator transcription factor [Rudaea sp.]
MDLKVAVLEDDTELREQILVPQLRESGFEVEGYAASGELFAAMPVKAFDLLVLDIGLPDVDGFTVARQLREEWPIGIVVLTGRRAAADRIKGLSEAADAWLVKPVGVDVLAATLQSLARRMRMPLRADEVPARWRLSPEGWRLHAPDGRSLALNHSGRRLLARLFETPGELVTHDELVRTLVHAVEDFDPHRLEMLIHRLRRKVAAELGRPLPLRSVRGQGYIFFVDDEGEAAG